MDILVSFSEHYSTFINSSSFMIGLSLQIFLVSIGVFTLCWVSYKVTLKNIHSTRGHIKNYFLYRSLKKHLVENNQWKKITK